MKLKLIIDRIEGEKAVLKNENGDTFIWPAGYLPEESGEKNILTFLITKGKNKDEKLAKSILNEILNA